MYIYAYAQTKKAQTYIYIILYGMSTNTQKATILQTSKPVPCMIKGKITEGFPATAVTTEMSEIIHDLKKKKHMQQNQYGPLALSYQAAVVVTSVSHMLLEHNHDASRNIFSRYREKPQINS